MRAVIITTAEMTELFQVTRVTIAQWTKAGMPKVSQGKYDLLPAFDWWKENINSSKETPETEDARERYWNAKAEEAEIKVSQAKDKLISKADVFQEWAWRAAELKTGLRSWSSRLSPKLEGKDLVELRVVLRDAADELLNAYCRSGRFTPEQPKEKPTKKPATKGKRKASTPKKAKKARKKR